MKLTLTSLSKKFLSARGWVRALHKVHLEIEDGEFFVLVGPSGCGKSTLLNLIAGLEKPTSGEIRFEDTIVASAERKIFVPTKERNVAMVFQSYALYPHMTVFENIAFPLRIGRIGAGTIEEAVASAAALLKISHILKARPKELSGGERQRVAIARAIVRKPAIFLMDEPLSNLDAKLRLTTRSELKSLQRKIGTTTVYVTHDQVEAMALGDRIGVIKEGMVQQVGTPRELYDTPLTPFVATFIGSPPMNLIETSYIRRDKSICVHMEGKTLYLDPSACERTPLKETGRCLLGIRPEHIEIVSRERSGIPAFRTEVSSIETQGREVLAHLCMEGIKLSLLSETFQYEPGDTIDISFQPGRLHLFPVDPG